MRRGLTRQEAYACVGKGWHHLLDNIYDVFEQEFPHQGTLFTAMTQVVTGLEPAIVQVKEKFGTLRVYSMDTNDVVVMAIEAAEDASTQICEECGEVGKATTGRSWVKTLCPKHTRALPRLKGRA